ncbi:hypothetical protein [Klebsiella pneumoniae]|uniref:hypothetical protein n=1 Tax=Klebsiella pneumoniae TaxID=573 RepID=UPI000C79BAFD|nr:hypothetical protein [Klebsiella pneumoniae]MBD0937848.1 hypothetical protein [Klebsiella pneumoniae]MCA4973850.1 hypothetical protein [Klebsiella pneumoniae]MCA5021928.1 hypothetical protein [Klebsiella pneumoniae]MCA5027158.1 hypothetical protein [Klebsiella pneumoniae]MCA5032314.1 hypothetical protein [Klebsiella pneumoniae]
MNIETVNELIASLESAGELSIRETKVMALAKAFKQLASENVALKSKGKELLGEACAVYSRLNKLIDPSLGDFVDGQTLHEFQFVLNAETPATDRIVAGIKADGVEEFAAYCGEENSVFVEARAYYRSLPDAAYEFAQQLREEADK